MPKPETLLELVERLNGYRSGVKTAENWLLGVDAITSFNDVVYDEWPRLSAAIRKLYEFASDEAMEGTAGAALLVTDVDLFPFDSPEERE